MILKRGISISTTVVGWCGHIWKSQELKLVFSNQSPHSSFYQIVFLHHERQHWTLFYFLKTVFEAATQVWNAQISRLKKISYLVKGLQTPLKDIWGPHSQTAGLGRLHGTQHAAKGWHWPVIATSWSGWTSQVGWAAGGWKVDRAGSTDREPSVCNMLVLQEILLHSPSIMPVSEPSITTSPPTPPLVLTSSFLGTRAPNCSDSWWVWRSCFLGI